jgi:hypothetical protein
MPVEQAHPKARPRSPGSLIASQIEALAGNRVTVAMKRERPWASITFAGTRQSFVIDWQGTAEPDGMHNLAKALPDYEFAIPGYFVADMLVTEQSDLRLLVEALSIIDPVEKTRNF